jgi:phage terminase large subunit GpA-like protein
LCRLVVPARSRDNGNTVLAKRFPGGQLVLRGANSATGLRSMPARYVFLDEVDAYPGDVDKEGDPLAWRKFNGGTGVVTIASDIAGLVAAIAAKADGNTAILHKSKTCRRHSTVWPTAVRTRFCVECAIEERGVFGYIALRKLWLKPNILDPHATPL